MRTRIIARLIKLSARQSSSYITTPIFYANAAPHLGHLYTTVLADAAHRWEQLKDQGGHGLHLLSTGTDEHGIKIYRAAEKAGKPPKEFCDEVSSRFKSLFDNFNISYTSYIRTTDATHRKAVEDIWNKLNAAGYIYKAKYAGWYSVVDECFYTDKDVEDGKVDGRNVKIVKGTNTIVDWIEEDNYMFKMTAFTEDIRHWLIGSDVIRPKLYLPLVLRSLENLHEDLSISRCRKRLPWGIPVPGDPDQTIYVWLDALVNYLAVTGYPDKQTVWPPTWQILGKDIAKFHAIYWPAFLLAAGLPLPERLFVHGHWLVENVKMSKSLGNVVDPGEAMKTYTVEGLRYFLLKQGVPQDDSNFSPVKAMNVINSDLVNNVGNLLSRGTVEKMNPEQIYPYLDIIEMEQEIKAAAELLLKELHDIEKRTTILYDQLLFYKAIEGLMAVVKQGNAFFQLQTPWKLSQGPHLSTILYLTYETVRIVSILLQPVVPEYACHALDRLGIPKDERHLSTAVLGGVKLGRPLGKDKGQFLQRLK